MKRKKRRKPINWNVQVKKPDYLPEMTKRLKARNEFFVASAIWKRINGLWVCVEASPKLEWMKKLDPGAAKLGLARRGYAWEWI